MESFFDLKRCEFMIDFCSSTKHLYAYGSDLMFDSHS